jgi:hypothetical protein
MLRLRTSFAVCLVALAALGASALAQDEEASAETAADSAPAIAFGDDSSVWAHDGECDDPRFEGRGMSANTPLDEDLGHDASDCARAHAEGRIRLKADASPELSETTGDDAIQFVVDERPTGDAPAADASSSDIDYGDDSGVWVNDGECDDPRFSGVGVAASTNRRNLMRDASDCRAAVAAGRAAYTGELPPAFEGEHDGVDFGDNSSDYAFDDMCDDPRFSGSGVTEGASRSGERRDAADCRDAYDRRLASYAGELPPLFEGSENGVDYGDNAGPYVADGECDDRRFTGPDVAFRPHRDNTGHDAHDCHEAVLAGTATYAGELAPLFEGSFDGVDFGDNASPYADDGECDDPRFRGPGMAATPFQPEPEGHDAADCQWQLARGFIRYVTADGLFEGTADGIDFGDNTGVFVNDGECDDSRFEGPGVSSAVTGENDRKDAFDCWLNYQDRTIVLKQ